MNLLQKALKENGSATMLGIAAYFYDPIFLEMAARLGFGVIWIEMEHGFITFAQAADLCRMARGTGMLTMIRVADASRENVMKAAECGPDIIDVPMIETREMVRQLIDGARFPPVGNRRFFSVSRALEYGLVESIAEEQKRLNDELCLIIQIETVQAVDRIESFARFQESRSSSVRPISQPASACPGNWATLVYTKRHSGSSRPRSKTGNWSLWARGPGDWLLRRPRG